LNLGKGCLIKLFNKVKIIFYRITSLELEKVDLTVALNSEVQRRHNIEREFADLKKIHEGLVNRKNSEFQTIQNVSFTI
jgi:hypothetical protein